MKDEKYLLADIELNLDSIPNKEKYIEYRRIVEKHKAGEITDEELKKWLDENKEPHKMVEG